MQMLLYCLVLYIKTIKRLHIKYCDACPFAKSQRAGVRDVRVGGGGGGHKFSASGP